MYGVTFGNVCLGLFTRLFSRKVVRSARPVQGFPHNTQIKPTAKYRKDNQVPEATARPVMTTSNLCKTDLDIGLDEAPTPKCKREYMYASTMKRYFHFLAHTTLPS